MSEPEFFLDRGLGSHTVPDALTAAGWSVVTMDERYGFERSQSISDVQWITDIAAEGLVGISKDRNIARVGIEVDAVVASSARLFLLPNSHLTALQMVERLVSLEGAIRRLIGTEAGPWIAVVQRGGLDRIQLDR